MFNAKVLLEFDRQQQLYVDSNAQTLLIQVLGRVATLFPQTQALDQS